MGSAKLIKASSAVGIGNVISQILGLLFLVIVARVYSTSDYGLISYTIQVGTLAASVVASGFPSALVRFIAKHLGDQGKVNEYFSNIISINLVLLTIVLLCTIILFNLNIGIISIVIGYSMVYIYQGIIRGFIDYRKIALFNVLCNIFKITILAVLCYVLFVESSILIILLYAFGGCISILILEALQPTHVHYSYGLLSKKVVKEIITFSIPVAITTFAYTAISSIPVIIINYFYDYKTVGLYSCAITLSTIFGFIPIAITTITQPTISHIEEQKRRLKYTTQSFWLILAGGIGLYIFILLFGKLCLGLLFSEKYLASYPLLLILSIGGIVGGLHYAFWALWEGSGHPIIATYGVVSAAIICVVSTFLLVPPLGAAGAAYGYCLGNIATILIDLYYWIKYRYTGQLVLEDKLAPS